MRFSHTILAALWFCLGVDAFVGQQQHHHPSRPVVLQKNPPRTLLESAVGQSSERQSSTNTSSGRTKEEIESELSSGRLLEGGQVMDFSAVKGPSRAEQALLDARKNSMAANDGHYTVTAASSSTNGKQDVILGINQEVIQEVGHELGTYADAETVQRCAAYLRSQAPPGLFEERRGDSSSSSATITNEERSSLQDLLRKAYTEAGEVTSAFAKTFYLGTQLLDPEKQKAIWAVYVWCRRTDEIVDAPREQEEDMLYDLSEWEVRLENLWKYGDVQDIFDLCLLDVRIHYPTLEITPFVDMIRGMLMDVPELGQERYDSFDELHLYCYRVAGTVGLMSLPVFGCDKAYTDEQAKEPALSLGVAFQLTNILRDVGEDAVKRGRIYLPRDDMKTFGVTEEQIFAQRLDDNYIRMMQFQIARARKYYERARRGVFMLAPESRLPVQISLDAYGKILDKIEENCYDSLTKRAYVGKLEKLLTIPFSWYRTLEISQVLPLPGDKPVSMEEPST